MKQIITEALNSTDLTDRINDAAALKLKISKDYRKDMKDVMNEYVQTMINLNDDIAKILKKPKKSQTEEDIVKYTEFVKKEKKNFQAVKKAICPVEKSDGTKELPLVKMVTKLSEICQMVSYLGRDDVLKVFEEKGIEIKFKPLEELRSEMKQEKVKENLKYIFQSAEEIEGQIQEAKKQIKNQYLDLDPSIRYSKNDPKNLEGLKPAQFEKLARQRVAAITKSEDDYTEFKEKNLESIGADITSTQLTFEKMQSM